jgi:TPR repeat protein
MTMIRSYCLIPVLLFLICACNKSDDPFQAYLAGDYKSAIKGFSILAKENNPVALTHLGVIYHMGLGTNRDLKKAFKYYMQAAEQGYAPAQYNIGLLYQSGLGTKQDYEAAYEYFNLAAKQDHHKARLAAEALVVDLKVRTQKKITNH